MTVMQKEVKGKIYETYSSGNSYKEKECVYPLVCECVCVCNKGACCKGLRYLLLLSVAAVGLVVPGGRRWHRNP